MHASLKKPARSSAEGAQREAQRPLAVLPRSEHVAKAPPRETHLLAVPGPWEDQLPTNPRDQQAFRPAASAEPTRPYDAAALS